MDITNIQYDVFLNLTKNDYNGLIKINFYTKGIEHLFLDFSGKEITSFEINGKEVDRNQLKTLWKEGKLYFPDDTIQKGSNQITIQFHNDYDLDGFGLHYLKDVDDKIYVYTQSCPYSHNRIMPLFDQPDLKGMCKHHLLFPSDWIIVANTVQDYFFKNPESFLQPETKKSTFEKLLCEKYAKNCFQNPGQSYQVFRRTQKLSSYLFSFVAGPFCLIKNQNTEAPISMGFYCRESLLKYAKNQSQYMFETLAKGITFYEKFFGCPYPFGKMDLICCPEFTWAAMENPGCITFKDTYFITKAESIDTATKTKRTKVILHELAHMWFGNMVTMDWWDGLWLNESFAEFTCHIAFLFVAPQLSYPTLDILVELNMAKNWGYDTDANIGSHPIVCSVADTNKANSIFDGITYSKGCAVLYQLYHLIGHENFSKSLKSYFAEFQWANARLDDLIRHFEQNSPKLDLPTWKSQWLCTAGTNKLQVDWDPLNSTVQSIKVRQSNVRSEFANLRTHKIQLGFLNEACEVCHVQEVVVEPKEETLCDFENKNYKAVIVNYGDWDFAQIQFDEHSLAFFKENLTKIKCSLSLNLIIRGLFCMVKDAQVKACEILDLLLNLFKQEVGNSKLLFALNSYITKLFTYMPSTESGKCYQKVFELMLGVLETETNKDTINLVVGNLVSYSIKPDQIKTMHGIYKRSTDENDMYAKITLSEDQILRIKLKVLMNVKDDASLCEEVESSLLKSDQSSEVKNYLLKLKYARMKEEEKLGFWNDVVMNGGRSLSFKELSFALQGFKFSHKTKESKKEYIEKYFEAMPDLIKNEKLQFARVLLKDLLPSSTDLVFLEKKFADLLEKVEPFNILYFTRQIREKIDDLKRIQRCFALYKSQ